MRGLVWLLCREYERLLPLVRDDVALVGGRRGGRGMEAHLRCGLLSERWACARMGRGIRMRLFGVG